MAFYDEPHWAVCGDTFPVGCLPDKNIVYGIESFANNPDLVDPNYRSKLGMYSQHCGLEMLTMSWGHDEYLYRVLKHNKSLLPQRALEIIRYHSFYPWHYAEGYKHLTAERDNETLHWVREFNQFDLYSKTEVVPDIQSLKPYYEELIDIYCPGKLKF